VYVNGVPVKVNEPRLSTFGVPGALPIAAKLPADVTLNVEFVYVRPEPASTIELGAELATGTQAKP
jgi:hypothetical protein